MKVALNRPGKFSRSKQSRSNVPLKYASARRFFARLASEIFLTSLQTAFFDHLLVDKRPILPGFEDAQSCLRTGNLSIGLDAIYPLRLLLFGPLDTNRIYGLYL